MMIVLRDGVVHRPQNAPSRSFQVKASVDGGLSRQHRAEDYRNHNLQGSPCKRGVNVISSGGPATAHPAGRFALTHNGRSAEVAAHSAATSA